MGNKMVANRKLYHFYMDEGGLIGDAVVLISNKKLRSSSHENHISSHYKGRLYKEEILLYVDRFKRLYPKCKVDITDSIEISFKARKEFPRKMMVSDDKINWFKCQIIGKVKAAFPYITLGHKIDSFSAWKYAKEIN